MAGVPLGASLWLGSGGVGEEVGVAIAVVAVGSKDGDGGGAEGFAASVGGGTVDDVCDRAVAASWVGWVSGAVGVVMAREN